MGNLLEVFNLASPNQQSQNIKFSMNSQPNTLQNTAFISNPSGAVDGLVQVSGDCINLETNRAFSITKVQQQVLNHSGIMSSATALHNAAKIQRI